MAGDTANARLWQFGDVYVGDTTATDPSDIDDEFDGTWNAVGLLDGEAGFVHSRSEDVNDFFAWGNILVRTSRTNFKYTISFVCLEDNETTRSLLFPGSGVGEIVVPQLVQVKIAFQTVDQTLGVTHRFITANYAEVNVDGDVTWNETDIAKLPMIASIIPDATTDPAVLFIEQKTEAASS